MQSRRNCRERATWNQTKNELGGGCLGKYGAVFFGKYYRSAELKDLVGDIDEATQRDCKSSPALEHPYGSCLQRLGIDLTTPSPATANGQEFWGEPRGLCPLSLLSLLG